MALHHARNNAHFNQFKTLLTVVYFAKQAAKFLLHHAPLLSFVHLLTFYQILAVLALVEPAQLIQTVFLVNQVFQLSVYATIKHVKVARFWRSEFASTVIKAASNAMLPWTVKIVLCVTKVTITMQEHAKDVIINVDLVKHPQ